MGSWPLGGLGYFPSGGGDLKKIEVASGATKLATTNKLL